MRECAPKLQAKQYHSAQHLVLNRRTRATVRNRFLRLRLRPHPRAGSSTIPRAEPFFGKQKHQTRKRVHRRIKDLKTGLTVKSWDDLSRSNGFPRRACRSTGLADCAIHGTRTERSRSPETEQNWSLRLENVWCKCSIGLRRLCRRIPCTLAACLRIRWVEQ